MFYLKLEIIVDGAGWRRIPNLNKNLHKAANVLGANLPRHLRIPAKATLLLTTDAKMRNLNRNFRGVDKATNVLSFPQFGVQELPKKGKIKQPVYLGDISLGYQHIVYEANEYNKILINYVTHLMIHGILHLLGYDHGTDTAARRMEGLEKKVLAKLNMPDPYVS